MKFSAITREEILRAFRNLTEINKGLADAADARRAIDLIWGATLTRFFTLASNTSDVYSIGRVQTPTLALIVKREKEIESFVPQKYWEVVALLENGLKAKHKKGRFDSIEEAQRVKLRSTGLAEVFRVEKSTRKRRPPHPMDTTTFLALSASIGISVDRAMKIAEDLYRLGYISYPRTDNTVYPESLDLIGIAKRVCKGPYAQYLQLILSQETITPTRGPKETKDHPPIHPVEYLPIGKLSKEHEAIYDLITRYFLATLSPPSVWEHAIVHMKIGSEEYLLKGRRLVDPGWERILKLIEEESEEDEEMLKFDIVKGQKFKVHSIKVVEKKTRPPKRYTQASLVKEMERLGLGTKSTRHEIIRKLFSRRYVEGKYIRPTNLGRTVIELVEKFVPIISSSELTRKIEKEMDEIEAGKKCKEEVINNARRILKEIFEDLMKNVALVGNSIRESKKKDLESSKKVGICPKCGAPLIIAKSRRGKRFIMCINYPKCNVTYPLPQKGRIYILKETCAGGKIHKIKVVWREKGVKKEWILCPSDYKEKSE
ncbi:MAG: topoisomerase DNA-binding C4 zinc finger domain-containing protein [Euryarchaeota archaeon]|nr:topoisomerase DNA-binding C4 zinc finger domain-containing protein [Euryarchaeota archaeon]